MYFWDFCVHSYTVDANRVSSVVLMELKTNKQKTNKKKTVTTVFVESILVVASENFHTSRSISYFFGEKCLLIKIFCATNVSPEVYTTVHAHLVGGISYLANKTKCTCLNVKKRVLSGCRTYKNQKIVCNLKFLFSSVSLPSLEAIWSNHLLARLHLNQMQSAAAYSACTILYTEASGAIYRDRLTVLPSGCRKDSATCMTKWWRKHSFLSQWTTLR